MIKAVLAVTDDDTEYPQSVYDVLAAILWVGNIEFEGGEEAKVKDKTPLDAAAKLFGCTSAHLELALT